MGFDAQKEGGETHIIEVELGGFDQSFREVRVERLEKEDDVACLEHTDPLFRGGVGNTGVVAQALEIEKLARSASAETYELLERGQVPDLADLAEISLDVGLEVVAER